MAEAEAQASAIRSENHPLGRIGARIDRRSPFMMGMLASAGVLVTVAAAETILAVRQELLLVLASLVLAIGMEPAVSWLVKHRFRRGLAVATVGLAVAAAVAGFLAAAIPALIDQGRALADNAPARVRSLESKYPQLRSVGERFHLDEKLQQGIGGNGGADLAQGVLGAGKIVFGAVTATVIVAVLVVYFSANFPLLRANLYRLFPQQRRPRAILIGDAIFTKVGGYVLGNLVISVITAVLTFIWLSIFDVPYPVLLAVLVAILDLIPLIGSTLAGVIITAVALTVSLPVASATLGFFLALRLVEDYLLVPHIMGRTVEVPGVVTVVAVVIGGALLGVLGALLAIPVAAAVLLLVREILFPRLDKTVP
nr:AI-2E family transporter [Nocardia kruczakiae]